MNRLFHFLQFPRESRLSVHLALLLIPSILLIGCYGEFALTKSLYEFNGDVSDNGFVQSIVMWILSFFIYSFAVLVDAAILNLIEFWTGDNPMTAQAVFENPDGSQVVMTPSGDGNSMQVNVVKDGETVSSRQIIKTSANEFSIQDGDGKQMGTVVRQANGSLELSRPDTQRKAVLTPAMISQFRSQAAAASL